MKKKIVSVLLATVLCASTVMAGCGDKKGTDTNNGGEATPAPTTTEASATETSVEEAPVVEAAKMEAPSTDGWDDSKKIYFYSWNDEFGSRMQYVLDAYPEYADYVEYVNLGCSGTDGTYQQTIDELLETGASADKYPSIIAADNDVAKYYTENDYTVSMESVGITDDMYANAYQYTKDYATYDGELKALTWQATPGCLIYRTDIAEEVLGHSDPDSVAADVKDWDAFFATADKMKEAGYNMVAGPDEIKYACFDQQSSAWITETDDGEALTLDKSVEDFFELSKKLYDGEYTANASMWDATWNGEYEGKTFAYFGCTWSVYWCMAFNKDDDGNPVDGSTYGKWNICAAPVSYHWGGTYVMITKDCPNPELAAFLVYSLCCDEDIMYTLACDTLDFVNNKAVIEKEIANGDGASPILGGQNPVEVWAESVKNIDLSKASYLDSEIKNYITDAAAAYNAGEVDSIDAAVQLVKDKVADAHPEITVE